MARLENAARRCSASMGCPAEVMKAVDISKFDVTLSAVTCGRTLLKALAEKDTVTLWTEIKVLVTRWESSPDSAQGQPDSKVQEFLEMCHKLAATVNGLHAQALENVAAIVGSVSGLKNDAFEPLRAGTAIRGLATVLKVFKASLSR